jgi:hypothetical protein
MGTFKVGRTDDSTLPIAWVMAVLLVLFAILLAHVLLFSHDCNGNLYAKMAAGPALAGFVLAGLVLVKKAAPLATLIGANTVSLRSLDVLQLR